MSYFIVDNWNMENNLYIVKDGRGCGRYTSSLKDMITYLFGGKVNVKYSSKYKCTKFTLHNDDIGTYNFLIYDETMFHESIYVRLSRMCEEYHGYMLYKYRDYKE